MAVALIVAAGSGERLGAGAPDITGGRPKAFVVLAGRPMVEWSVEALSATPEVEDIVVALPPGETAPAGTLGVPGGAVRSESVRAALDVAPASADRVVLVHDAARPLVTPGLAAAVIHAVSEGAEAAIAAAPVADTVKRAEGEWVVETLDRASLWAAQTPQGFRRESLERALDVPAEVLAAATDDASLVEGAGGRVRVVPAPPENLKVTTSADLRLAEALLSERAVP